MSKSKKKATEEELVGEDLQGRQAESLFPDLFPKPPEPEPIAKPAVSPPPPPERWDDNDDPDSRGEDEGRYALVLLKNPEQLALVEAALDGLGFTPLSAPTASRGIEMLRRAPYQVVVCGSDATFARFRDHLTKNVPQKRRRLIYYVLVGPHLHSCYNMEALAMSANMVVNDKDLPELEDILRKGFLAFERLFGSYLELLEAIERSHAHQTQQFGGAKE